MPYGTTGDESSRSVIRSSSVWQRPQTAARADFVWNENVPALRTVAPAEPVIAVEAVAPVDAKVEAAADLMDEIAVRRRQAFDELERDVAARRTQLTATLAQQREASERRIAETERLAKEAIERRREAVERSWDSSPREAIDRRADEALAAHLTGLRQRYADAEARLREHLETSRHDETARLEAWRQSERQRITAELAAEAERFNERLLRQLQEFEVQLGERSREHEERLARAWDEAEARTKQRLAALFDIPAE